MERRGQLRFYCLSWLLWPVAAVTLACLQSFLLERTVCSYSYVFVTGLSRNRAFDLPAQALNVLQFRACFQYSFQNLLSMTSHQRCKFYFKNQSHLRFGKPFTNQKERLICLHKKSGSTMLFALLPSWYGY